VPSDAQPGGSERAVLLAARLRAFRASCGSPSIRAIEQATRALGEHYPRSTINDKLNGVSAPSWPFVQTFLQACSRLAGKTAPAIDLEGWGRAHRAAQETRDDQRRNRAPLLSSPPRSLPTGRSLYRIPGLDDSPRRRIGIATGDLRRVRWADVWVNSENTSMRMARIEEYSISSILRYEGATRDAAGQVVDDLIAEDLDRRTVGRTPVPAGTAIITDAGELSRYNVQYVIHVASVQGEPGAGYRQVRDIGRCVTNALAAADNADSRLPVRTILFPLLGTGDGGADHVTTANTLFSAAVDYFTNEPSTELRIVYFLAYTDLDLAACEAACYDNGLHREILGSAADDGGRQMPGSRR
jgi:O-acetyl-ADP-ribose deacetylase (regulator of RNase III)